MLNLACEHKEFVARGYENNITSYPRQPKPIMQRGPKIKEMKETELHAGPIEILFVHMKSSDVCNFAGILIFLLLFFGVFLCGAPRKKNDRAFD